MGNHGDRSGRDYDPRTDGPTDASPIQLLLSNYGRILDLSGVTPDPVSADGFSFITRNTQVFGERVQGSSVII